MLDLFHDKKSDPEQTGNGRHIVLYRQNTNAGIIDITHTHTHTYCRKCLYLNTCFSVYRPAISNLSIFHSLQVHFYQEMTFTSWLKVQTLSFGGKSCDHKTCLIKWHFVRCSCTGCSEIIHVHKHKETLPYHKLCTFL